MPHPVRYMVVAGAFLLSLGASYLAASQFASEVYLSDSERFQTQGAYARGRELAYRSALANPRNGYAHLALGTNELLLGNHASAAEAFDRARATIPHQSNVLRLHGQSLVALERFDEAAVIMDSLYAMDPAPRTGADLLMQVRAKAYMFDGKYMEGLALASEAVVWQAAVADLFGVRLASSVAGGLARYGEALTRSYQRRFPHGQVDIQMALKVAISEERIAPLRRLLTLLWLRGDADASMMKSLALLFIREGQADDAVFVLNQIRRRFPDDPEIPLMQGDALFQAEHYEEARAHYRAFLALNPDTRFRSEIEAKLVRIADALSTGTATVP